MSIVDRAEELARQRHANQRYGDHPYSVHLEAVVGVLREFGFGDDEQMMAAGWLHDVVEDTGLHMDAVHELFGDGVANLVWAVTGQGPNRKARNVDAYRKLQVLPSAVPLKLADRLANVRSCIETGNASLLSMYRKEWPAFRDTLDYMGPPKMWARLYALMEGGDRDTTVAKDDHV